MGQGELVRVEYVFHDRNTLGKVYLVGDWNHWEPVEMTKDGNLWHVVVKVPVGYHEFCFIVDGKFVISRAHPLTCDESTNWRMIKGPGRLKSDSPRRKLKRTTKMGNDSPARSPDDTYGEGLRLPLVATMRTNPSKEHFYRAHRPLLYFLSVSSFYLLAYFVVALGQRDLSTETL